MSGGSYDYLYLAYEVKGLHGRTEDIERMAARLRELGSVKAASATLDIIRAKNALDDQAAAMAGVWKAVEWYDSGDWGLEQAQESIAEYEAKTAVTASATPPVTATPTPAPLPAAPVPPLSPDSPAPSPSATHRPQTD